MAILFKTFTALAVLSVASALPATRDRREESSAASPSGFDQLSQFGNLQSQFQQYMPQAGNSPASQFQGYVPSQFSQFGSLPGVGGQSSNTRRRREESSAASSSGFDQLSQFSNLGSQFQQYMPQAGNSPASQFQGYVPSQFSQFGSLPGVGQSSNTRSTREANNRLRREESSAAAASGSSSGFPQFGNFGSYQQYIPQAGNNPASQIQGYVPSQFSQFGSLPGVGGQSSNTRKRREESSAAAASGSSSGFPQFGNFGSYQQYIPQAGNNPASQIQGYVPSQFNQFGSLPGVGGSNTRKRREESSASAASASSSAFPQFGNFGSMSQYMPQGGNSPIPNAQSFNQYLPEGFNQFGNLPGVGGQ